MVKKDFVEKSDYSIQGKIEKSVSIFLARTNDTQTIIQREEIEDYIWLMYENALSTLKFENDKAILEKAITHALKKIDKLWDDVHGNFASHSGVNNIYSEENNLLSICLNIVKILMLKF